MRFAAWQSLANVLLRLSYFFRADRKGSTCLQVGADDSSAHWDPYYIPPTQNQGQSCNGHSAQVTSALALDVFPLTKGKAVIVMESHDWTWMSKLLSIQPDVGPWPVTIHDGGGTPFMNSMKLIIPLYFISWKKTPNDAVTPQRQSQLTPKMKAKRGSAFAFIFGVNWPWRCGVTALFGFF